MPDKKFDTSRKKKPFGASICGGEIFNFVHSWEAFGCFVYKNQLHFTFFLQSSAWFCLQTFKPHIPFDCVSYRNSFPLNTIQTTIESKCYTFDIDQMLSNCVSRFTTFRLSRLNKSPLNMLRRDFFCLVYFSLVKSFIDDNSSVSDSVTLYKIMIVIDYFDSSNS